MNTKNSYSPPAAKTAEESHTALPEAGQHFAPSPFVGFDGLARHLPMYKPRSLRELVKRRVIPCIRPPGTRKLNFYLPSVDAALLRHQTPAGQAAKD